MKVPFGIAQIGKVDSPVQYLYSTYTVPIQYLYLHFTSNLPNDYSLHLLPPIPIPSYSLYRPIPYTVPYRPIPSKAFRNEITPRNYIFRSREFEQMEIEYFIPPEDEVWPVYMSGWIDFAWKWLIEMGLKEEYMFKDVHESHKLAHYSKACTDITFKYPFGTQELMGIACRGNFDLTQHSEACGKALDYFDAATNLKYIPHVIEPSIGVDRLFLAILTSAYREETLPPAKEGGKPEQRVVLGFTPAVAPIKACILPLVNNKAEISDIARNLFQKLQNRYMVEYDTSGAIGRRYRRADESGIPFCITVDFDSIEDNTVTLRERDSMEQRRMTIEEVYAYLSKEIDGI